MAEGTTSKGMGTGFLIVIILIILGIIYFIFRDKINRFLGIGTLDTAPSFISCQSVFYAKLPNGIYVNVNKTDEGTTNNPMPAYYKNEVTFTENGIGSSGTPIKITKEEFDSLCQYKYDPPYAWYMEKQTGGTSVGHGRTR